MPKGRKRDGRHNPKRDRRERILTTLRFLGGATTYEVARAQNITPHNAYQLLWQMKRARTVRGSRGVWTAK